MKYFAIASMWVSLAVVAILCQDPFLFLIGGNLVFFATIIVSSSR